MSEEKVEVIADEEVPKVVDQEMLDANPELKEAGVEVGSPIELVDAPVVESTEAAA